MPYATQADLETAFGADELIRLTDRINIPPTTINAVTVGNVLDAATGMVDSYLAVRYTLPIPMTAESAAALTVLRGVVCDITRYMLLTVAPDDDVKIKYDNAIRYLLDLKKGNALLPGVLTGQPASAGMVEISTGERVFGRGVR